MRLLRKITQFRFSILEITCAAPVVAADSGMEVTTTALTVGGDALYSCGRGRRLVGQNSRQCQKSGLWNGSQPSCECNFHNLRFSVSNFF